MEEIDYNKLSDLVVKKLEAKNRPERDEEFVNKIVNTLVEHRSPCHNLNEQQVESIKEVVKKAKRLDKGITFISWALLLYILKNALELLAINIHWGGK